MHDFKRYSIVKEKVFWGFRSTDPPEYFENFLVKNLKNLKKLLDNNQLTVIDDKGNEINRIHWENIILSFYNEQMFGQNTPLGIKHQKDTTQTLKKKQQQQHQYQETKTQKTDLLEELKNERWDLDERNREALDRQITSIDQEITDIQTKMETLDSEIHLLNRENS